LVTPNGQTILFDIVNREITGTLHGNVLATTLTGTLTGNVVGNLTGNVVATTLTGTLTGNVFSNVIRSTNFSSGNAVIQGGYINNLANVSSTLITATTLNSVTTQSVNFSTGNIRATGGAVTGLAELGATTGQVTNFTTSNIHATGGAVTGLAELGATTGQVTNFTTSNIHATGGNVTGITNFSATNGQATNFTTGNIQSTGGAVTGLAEFSATNGQTTNLTTGNIHVTGGNVTGVVGSNNTFTSANLVNSVATTKTSENSTTAVATTAFVHAVMPTGIIVMWNNSTSSIPLGWQLCDGSNGTPDLRGQFIVGAGGSYAVGDTGGSASVTLGADAMPIHTHVLSGSLSTGSAGSHSHSATVTDPGHSHTTRFNRTSKGQNATPFILTDPNVGENINGSVNVPTNNATTGISVAVNSVLDHVHSLTLSGNTQSAGGSSGTTQPHENRPPYYALCYIQKMY
jgi:microcystin-dependent protein